MQKKYDIRFNPPKLSQEDIAKHKNFAAILEEHRRRSADKPKPAKVFSLSARRVAPYITAMAAAIALLLYFRYTNTAEDQNIQKAYFASQPYINQPLENIKKPFNTMIVSGDIGGTLTFNRGSKFHVPAAAFVNEKGEAVTGDVEIRYREFHDYVDFFLSGIPMTYDSAGVEYTLESAGMIEIYAEKGGQRVFLHPEKNIDVELVSEIQTPYIDIPPKYNIYQLDRENRRWNYQNPDKIQFLDEEEENGQKVRALNSNPELFLESQQRQALDELEAEKIKALDDLEDQFPKPQKPEKPAQLDGGEKAFQIDLEDFDAIDLLPINGKSLEEQKARYKGGLWQPAPGSPSVEQNLLSNVVWESIHLKQISQRTFLLKLFYGDSSVSLQVNPVYSAEEYAQALNEYQSEIKSYEDNLSDWNKKIEPAKKAIRASFDLKKNEVQTEFDEKIAIYRKGGIDALANSEKLPRKIVNRFEVNSFGIWNCDRPLPPAIKTVKAEFFNTTTGEILENTTAYLVDQAKNTVTRFYVYEGCEIKFNHHSHNLLWLITPEGKVAVYRPEAFKKINTEEEEHTFAMEVIEKSLDSENDLREVLYF